MKKLFTLILLISLAQSAMAVESVISYFVVNNKENREIEVVMVKDKMYLPCKYILDYLSIPYKENHVDKTLSFKNVTIKNDALFTDGKKQSCSVYFVKNGITGLKNEYFLPAEALSKVTGENITSDSSQLLAFLNSASAIVEDTKTVNGDTFGIESSTPKIMAHEQVTVPVKSGWISLDTVGIKNNMMSDSYAQIYKETQTKSAMMTNNTVLSLRGKAGTGDYKVDFGTNSYADNIFSFSGISPQYKNKLGEYDYLLGKIDSWEFGTNNVGSDILGVQIKDHVEKDSTYKDIEGTVAPTSTVCVHINDDYEKALNTYGGEYSLKDVYYNGKVEKIRIDEVLADGTKKEIFSKNYYDSDRKNVPKKDYMLGITGLQNRLWANNGYIYQSATKKAVAGAKFYNQLTDKIALENFVIADKIISGSVDNFWGQSILGNKKYLNFTTMRNPSALEGETYMGLLTFKNSEKMNSQAYFGASNSISHDPNIDGGTGFFLKYDNNYQLNKETALKGSIFASSPNFYMAGSSSGGGCFMQDRVGASVNVNTKIKNTTISGSYSKYKSNFGNYYDGGLLDFDDYTFMARANFKKMPSISLKLTNKQGQNEIGQIRSSSYDLNATKRIKCFNFNAGVKNNSYSNQYSAEGYASYNSDYTNYYADVNFPLGKKFGNLTVGHECVSTKSDDRVTDYKTLRLNYSTPTFKGMNLNFMTGFHYAGLNKGNDLGFGIMKRLKSGSVVSLNYRFSQAPCYIIDNMYIPSNVRHSISLDFSELYGLGSKGLEAIGSGNENKGYIQATAFLDLNQNGIKDKDEPNIDNIPIKVENISEVLLTAKDGNTKMKAEDEGVYNVKVFEDELPTFLSCHKKTQPSRYVKVVNRKKTNVDFGLISSVGNINGCVTLTDQFNNPMLIKDIVVSVFDSQGKEVDYTNLNEDGTYSISGLNPGKYTVSLDKNFQEAYHLSPDGNQGESSVVIPPEYKNYVNIDNVNLSYKLEY